MNINLTLFLQMIAFAVFVWFCMKFVWPPIVNALAERKTKIAEGLAAAERGHHEQELGQKRAKEIMQEAKQQAAEIVNQAQKRAAEIVEEAKGDGDTEGERILTAAKAEIEQETNRAREELREKVAATGRGRRREDPAKGDRRDSQQVHRRFLRQADLGRDYGRRHHYHRSALCRSGVRARPGSGQLDAWSEALELLAAIAGNAKWPSQIGNPNVPRERVRDMILDIAGDSLTAQAQNLVKLLAENDRLAVLPEIARLFEVLKTEQRGVRQVHVRSAYAIDADQQTALATGA